MDEGRPIFVQIAEQIEDSIIEGSLAEGDQAPSTNELAAFHRINPATAAKGLHQLLAEDILHKRRGVGMFVGDGARERLRDRRRVRFTEAYVRPLLAEARRLGITPDELSMMIKEEHS